MPRGYVPYVNEFSSMLVNGTSTIIKIFDSSTSILEVSSSSSAAFKRSRDISVFFDMSSIS